MNRDKSIIIACRYLKNHLDAAQLKMGTDIPVIELDTKLHRQPEKMRARIMREIGALPPEYGTILVAMAFCGGSWREIISDRRIVIPRMDDCISILLTVTDDWVSNRKKTGCMYLTDNRNDGMTIPEIYRNYTMLYGERRGKRVFQMMFDSYNSIGIIDSDVYDSRDREMLDFAKQSAELINGSVEHVPGSNMVLEKLVSGNWDEQFLILEPGTVMTEFDLWEN
ncbi:MAG: DUF1638 domain-containing protein [Oscillospiraceae bacterium]|nr:DUF1638 domain-containing protein [Oscillospiraceae bacterium]